MSNNNEDHIWITSQSLCVCVRVYMCVYWGEGGGGGAATLSISQMCKPYALTEIKTKKKQ